MAAEENGEYKLSAGIANLGPRIQQEQFYCHLVFIRAFFVIIKVKIKLECLLGAVDKVLGALGLDLPVDIAPIIKYLQSNF